MQIKTIRGGLGKGLDRFLPPD